MRRHNFAGVAGGPGRAVAAAVLALAAAATVFLANSGPTAAQFLGPEFQINTFTAGDQAFPSAVSI